MLLSMVILKKIKVDRQFRFKSKNLISQVNNINIDQTKTLGFQQTKNLPESFPPQINKLNQIKSSIIP